MSALFSELVKKRGLNEDFLRPKYEDLADPFGLPDMDKAVERLAKATKNGEKVLIYGDYDVDGVTASTAMHDVLKLIGIKEIEIMLPDRFKDGYGMSEKVVERAKGGNFTLVVTVDCGSRNHEIIAKLRAAGIDTIVTDHHECGEDLPVAIAVVNPKITGVEKSQSAELSSEKGLRDLAGVGVVFELARALVKRGLIPDGQEKWLLDLVLIGTICDAMRISQENRILTYWGMKVLAKTRRPGLKELMRVAKITKINTEAIGFRIGPRLNAAGRIESAGLALKLLLTNDRTEAALLAMQLEGLNNRRRDMQIQAIREIEAAGVGDEPVIIKTGKWPEGVLGIIAGKLVEKYKRPAFVLSLKNGVWKGSGRSFGEFNLAAALDDCRDILMGGGGHAEACGVKIAEKKIGDFMQQIVSYYKSLNLRDQEKFLETEADLEVRDLKGFGTKLLEEMAELEPFGEGNPEPIFCLKDMMVMNARKMGKEQQHLAISLRGADGGQLKIIAFGAPEDWLTIMPGERITALVRLVENEFRGIRSVEAEAVQIQREN